MKPLSSSLACHVGSRLAALVLGLAWGAGCSPHKPDAPPADQIRDAFGAALPPYLAVAALDTETIPTGPDQAKVNAKVTVTPKEALYLPERRVPGDPSLLLLKSAQTAGAKTTLYGFVAAQRTLDRWTLSVPQFTDGLESFGRPRNAFGPQSFVAGTPEATAAIQALNEHAETLERERQIREDKERQARQAQVEQTQREAQALKERLLRATAPGTRYLGTLTNPYTHRTQRLRLSFTEQTGTLLRAEVTNPDQPADHRPLTGELVLSSEPANPANPAAAAKVYPVQLSAGAVGKQETINGRWGLYWGAGGPLRLAPTDEGGLEGEAVIFQTFGVRLQPEP